MRMKNVLNLIYLTNTIIKCKARCIYAMLKNVNLYYFAMKQTIFLLRLYIEIRNGGQKIYKN